MSPERFERCPLTPATDWYACLGAMLYEALAGRPLFVGDLIEVMHQKQLHKIVAPSQLAENVPEDIEKLCLELLSPHPERRPDGKEIIRRLERKRADGIEVVAPVQPL
jgi:serine/threonine protein kinase